MGNSSSQPQSDESAVKARYQAIIEGWNLRDAAAMVEPFADDGVMIGFDGSQAKGWVEMAKLLAPIFNDHPTAAYVIKVKEVRLLSQDVALLQAIAGMIPPGKTDLMPERNVHQTVVAVRRDGKWSVVLLQNTPARFDGRPELVQQMTEELRQAV